jgi:hypothetical protein
MGDEVGCVIVAKEKKRQVGGPALFEDVNSCAVQAARFLVTMPQMASRITAPTMDMIQPAAWPV